ncbi:uncharacterized protein LOC131429592 [Malaya genurostris]|uniref:uncharacterized protein LOC131429592 n=1 Tax=Malaya genurostris TaxID=325434 RepID=UPI0026F3FCA8|nr:uncharacterized protein LOC131429592 [Malaya genurostris]XP_058449809.1 uncharacterized protein LOC131429592 [Malaya genurostris]XP_058449817.1 uncharacterized protein LOC131429592 [Malaya genurostris]
MTHIENFPNELLEKIFLFLPVEDLESTALVCSSWKNIILTVIIPKHVLIHIKPVHPVTHQLMALPALLSSQAMNPFPKFNYKITIANEEHASSPEYIDFFQHRGASLKSLSLQIMQLTEPILKTFPYLCKLEEISLTTESDDLYAPQPQNPELYLSSLKNLQSLKLTLPNYVILRNASSLSAAPLHHIALERFEIELHHLKPLLEPHASTLRQLTVRVDEMKPFLQYLNSLGSLKLERLNIKSGGNDDDFTEALIQLFDQQPHLRTLKIGSELSLRAVAAIPRMLFDLEELEFIAESIHDCRAFVELKHLRKLTMSLYDVRAWDETVSLVSVVDFSLSVTFPLISPAIFCSFPNMKRFYLEDVDDDSLMRDIVVVQTLLKQIQDVEYLDLENFVLKEREILNESVARFDTLPRLKMLKYSCRDMSDASLLTMDLPELRELYLTHCPGVTFKGISFITRACPMIETLHVEFNKTGFDDNCMDLITRKLIRLRRLYLINLRGLTNETIELVTVNCQRLRELTFSYCIGISMEKADAIEKLSSIKTLRNLIYS